MSINDKILSSILPSISSGIYGAGLITKGLLYYGKPFVDSTGVPPAQFTPPVVSIVDPTGSIYYVSKSVGDDSRTSAQAQNPLTPWEHHPWDANATGNSNSLSLSAGDAVILKRGDTWYDCQLTPNRSGNITDKITTKTIDDFGIGIATLSGAYDPDAFSWANGGGGVFSSAAVTEPEIVTFNDIKLLEDTTTPTAPTLGKYGWEASVLYVNIDGVSSPTSGSLLASKRNYVIADGGSHLVFSNFYVEYANETVGLGACYQIEKDGVVFDNLHIKWYKNAGILQFKGDSGVVTNCTVDGKNTSSYGIRFASGATNSLAAYNDLSNTPSSRHCLYIENVSSSVFVYNDIHDTPGGTGIGVKGSSSNNIIAYNNIYNHNKEGFYYPNGSGVGIMLGLQSGDTCSGNRIFGNTFNNNYQNLVSESAGGTGGNVVSSNIFKGNIVNGIKWNGDPNIDYNIITSNTFIHEPSEFGVGPYTGHAVEYAAKKAIIANNIFYLLGKNANCQAIVVSVNRLDVRIDNNLYYNSFGETCGYGKIESTEYTSLATWQAAIQADPAISDLSGISSSAEANAIDGDPVFVDFNGGDYRLQAASPCRNDGASSFINGNGNQFDKDGYQIWDDDFDSPVYHWREGVDIGAYAYGGESRVKNTPSVISGTTWDDYTLEWPICPTLKDSDDGKIYTGFIPNSVTAATYKSWLGDQYFSSDDKEQIVIYDEAQVEPELSKIKEYLGII
jgi:hypothetical protein